MPLDMGDGQEPEADPAAPQDTVSPPQEDESDDEQPSQAAKIRELEKRLVVPETYKAEYRRFQEDRDYVASDCVADMDAPTTSLTNFILRNQRILISQVYARDPRISVHPQVRMGAYGPGVNEFAQTQELLLPRLAQEAEFKPTLTGMLQDVQTCGIAWLKTSMQIDPERDPIGARRHNDQLDAAARLDYLLQEFEAGEFDETDAKYQDMVDLSDTVRAYLRDQLTQQMQSQPMPPSMPGSSAVEPPPVKGQVGGPIPPPAANPQTTQLQALNDSQGQPLDRSVLPQVAVFMGFNLDPVQPEDIRFDWDITRPEDIYQSHWMAHRVYMTCDDIRRMDPDYDESAHEAAPSKDSGAKQQDRQPADRSDLEDPMLNGRRAVWELWDRDLFRRYVWVQGTDKFLTDEAPKVTWRRFFPFAMMAFNRVTGKVIPLSDVRLQMPHQDEINQKRTHEREAQKAAYPRYIVPKGTIKDDEKAKIEEAVPYAVIEIERADDVNKYLKELATSFKFDPKLYDTSKAEREMEYVAGISQASAGQTGGSTTATEAAVADQAMGQQADFRKTVVEDFIGLVYTMMADMAIIAFPEMNVKEIVGPGAVWPVLDRENLWRGMQIEIVPGSSGAPDHDKEFQLWTNLQGLIVSLGQTPNGVYILQQCVRALGRPIDLSQVIVDPMVVMQAQARGIPIPGAPPPGGAGPSSGGANNAPAPAPQPGPGAPPMNERPVPKPNQIPNGPLAHGGSVAGPPPGAGVP